MSSFRDIHYRLTPHGKWHSTDHIEVVLENKAKINISYDKEQNRRVLTAHKGKEK